ncbi:MULTISPECIES: hypothetical protein [Myxococcus]|uniref:Uncharacterized protein n=1 Tax=Myxococcus virescens TaxID=83456 RepID=A0A511H8G2_9BACT|nr:MULTISPECIES: hypothetical protein [Myxococcus]QQR46925.1 hypothetical protein JKA73_12995 [Myxococcus xanthus]GEL69694.1 hypothetical protein MVI01_14780 [Myxococcus virescens]SDD90358.1 hypothetical protein SAMN04488504_103181 [Myxococcus virescens]
MRMDGACFNHFPQAFPRGRGGWCKLEGVTKLFLPQTQLEEWALADKADLREGRLVVMAEGGVAFPLTPAVHFVQLVSGEDTQGLVARVKTEEQLARLGAEQMADSVLVGDNAYEVVPGYVAEVAAGAPRPEGADKKPDSEADLLAAFILNKMG